MPEQSTTHRHAYLVLAHEDVDMLNILTNRLVNTGFVYIHIDRKSPITIEQVVQHPKVKITKQIKVNWVDSLSWKLPACSRIKHSAMAQPDSRS